MTEVQRDLALENQQKNTWILVGVLVTILTACYWNTLTGTAVAWDDPMYSHGYLIPLFAAFLLYSRREPFGTVTQRERWLGVGIIAAGTVLRVFGSFMVQFTVDRLTIVVCLLGVFVLVGGLKALRWAGPAIGFLIFMFPLPRILVDNILRPMQTMATISSVYALQTLGVEVFREGNRIVLEQNSMGVVDQCSGLRMLTIFIALAVAIVLISKHRPLWERAIILLSSIPIALLVNCIRITITGFCYERNLGTLADRIFHDFAGVIMMPLALGFLFLVMQILSRLIIEDGPSRSLGVDLGKSP